METPRKTWSGRLSLSLIDGNAADTQQLHPLLQESDEIVIDNDGPDDIGLKRSAPTDTSLLDAPGSEFAPVLEQLRRSLENMQSNHAQIEGINEAMNDAQAALDSVLFKNTSAQQYAVL